MRGVGVVLRWIALALCMLAPRAALAENLVESLVSPGPLAQGHARYEAECGKCHAPFARKAQPGLCLDCHKEIARDRREAKGFHGRDRLAASADCAGCHGEHKGRAADIRGLSQTLFDHAATNYPLQGGHALADCAACHRPNVAFHKTPTRCRECHDKVDPHKGRLEDCGKCHDVVDWRRIAPFDHGKTKFPLRDAHGKVACATCHSGEAWRIATDCASCHRLQDVHNGRYGEKCGECHDEKRWKAARYDHDRTRYPLRGGHVAARCDACHAGALAEKLETSCIACHKPQDIHRGSLGPRCERCHSVDAWDRTRFDHAQSRFPLAGKHVTTPCVDCHVTPNYKETPTACASCHADAKHKGRLGARPDCGACHKPDSWKTAQFDHARRAHWPLLGGHARAPCESCHKQVDPPTLKLSTACESCHEDMQHKGRLGARPRCADCHDPSGWSHWTFDHAAKTTFPLVGAHQSIACEGCHRTPSPPSLKLESACAACHRKDDAHNGAFGRFCERCHSPQGWKKVDIRN